MTSRIHILLDEDEKARYRRHAEREGKSLGAWRRAPAEDRIRASEGRRPLRTRGELERFFAESDARETGDEPDWAEHLQNIERSRLRGLDIPCRSSTRTSSCTRSDEGIRSATRRGRDSSGRSSAGLLS